MPKLVPLAEGLQVLEILTLDVADSRRIARESGKCFGSCSTLPEPFHPLARPRPVDPAG